MKLRVHQEPDPPGYLIRDTAEAGNRGPFTLEQLRDLAEFGNLTADYFIRHETEESFRRLGDDPEIMRVLFPEKEKFAFREYRKTEDPDADRSAVDVRDLYTCNETEAAGFRADDSPVAENGGSSSFRFAPGGRPHQSRAVEGYDVAADLRASLQTERERVAAGETEGRKKASWFAVIWNTSIVVRWVLAGVLVFMALGHWMEPGIGLNLLFNFLFGLLYFGCAVLLVGVDLARWLADFFVDSITDTLAPQPPPDYKRVNALLEKGEFKKAISELEGIIHRHPREIQAYTSAIEIAAFQNQWKTARRLHELARVHLSKQDQNLLDGSLRRKGVQIPGWKGEASGTPAGMTPP